MKSHDLWPLSPIELGGMSKNHPFIVWMQMAENYAYRKADYIVSMLPNTIEHMISHGMDKRKWHFIPNGFVSSDWENPEKLSSACIAKVESIKSDFNYLIGYTGGLGISNAMDNFFKCSEEKS